MPDIGDMAPDFDIACDGGSRWRLGAQRPAPVVLVFYGQDGTPSCTNELMEFNALLPQFDAFGARILGLSKDKIAAHERFKAKMGIGFALGSDHGGNLMESWGAYGEKIFFGKPAVGVLRSSVLIDKDGRIAAIWRVEKVKGHAAEVLAALEKIGQPVK